ncbi:MAG: type II toxin-antitoxin system RelE/ParE family toxin [Patescibacteria group bacterium]
MKISYAPVFIRQYNKLDGELQNEIVEKIELFRKKENHKLLRVHKLKGNLLGSFSFSVNYRFRIIFEYLSKNEAVLLLVGDHEIYS